MIKTGWAVAIGVGSFVLGLAAMFVFLFYVYPFLVYISVFK